MWMVFFSASEVWPPSTSFHPIGLTGKPDQIGSGGIPQSFAWNDEPLILLGEAEGARALVVLQGQRVEPYHGRDELEP
jgi:hypothetical protein